MKVGELLKHLDTMPRDAEVIVIGCYASSGVIEDVDYELCLDFEKKTRGQIIF